MPASTARCADRGRRAPRPSRRARCVRATASSTACARRGGFGLGCRGERRRSARARAHRARRGCRRRPRPGASRAARARSRADRTPTRRRGGGAPRAEPTSLARSENLRSVVGEGLVGGAVGVLPDHAPAVGLANRDGAVLVDAAPGLGVRGLAGRRPIGRGVRALSVGPGSVARGARRLAGLRSAGAFGLRLVDASSASAATASLGRVAVRPRRLGARLRPRHGLAPRPRRLRRVGSAAPASDCRLTGSAVGASSTAASTLGLGAPRRASGDGLGAAARSRRRRRWRSRRAGLRSDSVADSGVDSAAAVTGCTSSRLSPPVGDGRLPSLVRARAARQRAARSRHRGQGVGVARRRRRRGRARLSRRTSVGAASGVVVGEDGVATASAPGRRDRP